MNLILEKNKYFFDSILNNSFCKKDEYFFSWFSAIIYITSKFNFSKNWIQKLNSYFVDFKEVKKSWLFCKQHSLLGQLWLPTPHCAVPVRLRGLNATPLVTSYFPPTLLPRVLQIWERVFYSQAFFTLNSFLLVSRPPRGPQFNLKVSRASCWSWEHSTGPTICLNHSNPQKGL